MMKKHSKHQVEMNDQSSVGPSLDDSSALFDELEHEWNIDGRSEDQTNDQSFNLADFIDSKLLSINQSINQESLSQIDAVAQSITQELQEITIQHAKLANSSKPLLINHKESISRFNLQMKSLDRQSQSIIDTINHELSELQPIYKSINHMITETSKADRVIVYHQLQQRIEELSESAREFFQSTNQSNQTISDAIKAASDILLLARIRQQLIDESSSHSIKVAKLDSILHHRLLYLNKLSKDRLIKMYQSILQSINWPQSINHPLLVNDDQLLKNFVDLTETLIMLQLAEDDNQSINQPIKAINLWVFDCLFDPLHLSFRFHFIGKQSTNRLDKPEWFTSWFLQTAMAHIPFLQQHVQPIINRTINRTIAQSLIQSDNQFIDCSIEFLSAMLVDVRSRINHDLPQLVDSPQLFRHCLDQVIKLESSLRSSSGQLSTALSISLPSDRLGCLEPFLQSDVFERWLKVDKDWVNDRLEALRELNDPWTILNERSLNQSNDQSDSDDESYVEQALLFDQSDDQSANQSDSLLVTRSAHFMVTLMHSINDRFDQVPLFSAKLRFLQDLAYQLLDIYCEYLASEGEIAIQSINQSINQTINHRSWQHLMGVLNSCYYVIVCLNDWNDQLQFIELQLFASYPDRFDQSTSNQTINQRINELHEHGVELKLDTGLFAPIIELYENVKERVTARLTSIVTQSFLGACDEYIDAGHQYVIGGDDRSNDSSMVQPSVQTNQPISPNFMPALLILRVHLHMLQRGLSVKLFDQIWPRLARRLDDALFKQTIDDRYVSVNGMKRLVVDLTALIEVFTPYSSNQVTHLPWLSDAINIYSLSANEAKQLIDTLNGARAELIGLSDQEREVQWRRRYKVFSLTEQQVRSIINHMRVESNELDPRRHDIPADRFLIDPDDTSSIDRSTSLDSHPIQSNNLRNKVSNEPSESDEQDEPSELSPVIAYVPNIAEPELLSPDLTLSPDESESPSPPSPLVSRDTDMATSPQLSSRINIMSVDSEPNTLVSSHSVADNTVSSTDDAHDTVDDIDDIVDDFGSWGQ